MNDATTAIGSVRIGINADENETRRNNDDADDDCFFEQVSRKFRSMHESNRSGRNRTDFDSGGSDDLVSHFSYAINDGESIHAVAHDDDAATFPFALPFSNPSRMSGRS